MERSLREHIAYLEERISSLQQELLQPGRTPYEQASIKIDLGIATRSLVHFQKAFELEQKVKK